MHHTYQTHYVSAQVVHQSQNNTKHVQVKFYYVYQCFCHNFLWDADKNLSTVLILLKVNLSGYILGCCTVYWHFRGSKNLWNIGKLLTNYIGKRPRRQPTSYTLPWEPHILQSDSIPHLHLCLLKIIFQQCWIYLIIRSPLILNPITPAYTSSIEVMCL
jgi:hypothetical protein